MKTEVEHLRAELAMEHQRYLALCQMVEMRAGCIYGKAGNDKAEEAAELTAELLQDVATAKHQFLMLQEKARGYDLAALAVNVDIPSNSETE